MRPAADQETLVQQFLNEGKSIESLRQSRKEIARTLAESLGLSGTARRLGVTRQSLSQLLGPDRPRGVPSEPPLRRLVEARLLEPGETLLLPRRGLPPFEAHVLEDGRIQCAEGGEPVATPSAAFTALTGGRHADGWTRLKSARSWRTLAQLREELESVEGPASP
jgi:hypothetical protein